MRINRMRAALFTAAGAVILLAAPSESQGQSRNQERERDRDRAERYEDRDRGSSRGNGAGKVPPGWCRGQGNPHNTVENCGYRSDRDDRYNRDDRYDRDDRYYDSRNGSYEREHDNFHQYLDRKYSDLAANRPLDIAYQIQLRVDKAAEHDRWHRDAGIRH